MLFVAVAVLVLIVVGVYAWNAYNRKPQPDRLCRACETIDTPGQYRKSDRFFCRHCNMDNPIPVHTPYAINHLRRLELERKASHSLAPPH